MAERTIKTRDGMTHHVSVYNVRDQIGHFVAPRSQRGHPCHHRCCSGKRVHPDKLPVKLDRTYLRSLSNDELDEELGLYVRYYDKREQGARQVMAEVDRREESGRKAGARKERARDRRQRAESEYQDEVYRQWLRAEGATNGFMLNKAGQRAGINERTLFNGPESRVKKYASPELIDFFEANGRPTRTSWFGTATQRRAEYASSRMGR